MPKTMLQMMGAIVLTGVALYYVRKAPVIGGFAEIVTKGYGE